MGANLYVQASEAVTASGQTAALEVGPLTTLAVDVNVSAASGTTPTLDLYVDRLGADGIWYQIWHGTQVTGAGQTSTSIGPSCATNNVVTSTVRFRWVVGGTTPSFTFSCSIVAR